MNKKIVIIGSGFGGLAMALRMRKHSEDVTLIEKHNDLGGRARTFNHKGYSFDAGPTVITAPYLINELFTAHAKDPKDYFELMPVKPWYRFVFDDHSHLDYGDNIYRTIKNIKNSYGIKNASGYVKLLKKSKKIFNKAFIELSDYPFESLLGMIKFLPDLIKIRFDQTVFKSVASHVDHTNLQKALSMHSLLVGGNPYSTTSIYLLIQYLEWKYGVYYAKGGTGSIVNGMEKLLTELGVNIIKGTEAKKIDHKDGQVKEIITENNNIKTDICICNSDASYTYNNLLGIKPKKISNKYSLRHSMSLFVMYFATKKIYLDVQHHTIFFSKRHKDLLNDIFNKKILINDPSLYLHRPSATDSTMIQNGHDTFYVLAPVPNNYSGINWEEIQEDYSNLLVDIMDKNLLPNLKNEIVEKFYITPEYFENDLNSFKGNGFGIEPIFRQSAYFRFANNSREINNLFFVGSNTHPGAGVPGVISSAKVTEKVIMKKYA